MIHTFFKLVSTQPTQADKFACVQSSQALRFSQVFSIFFPEGGHQNYGANLSSWLNVISGQFLYFEGRNPEAVKKVELLFEALKVPNQPRDAENIHVFHFWLYLHVVYWKLVEIEYTRQDNVFGFMTGFPIEETRVVIIGNDPAKYVESSGFAFHGSVTESTDQILDFVSGELAWISDKLEHSSFEVDADELDAAKCSANLNGWIQQGVLLLNSSLTYTDSDNDFEVRSIRIAWKTFTNFLVRHLSSSFEHLTFLLLGREAWPMVNVIEEIDKEKHMIQQFYHPSFFRYSSFELHLVKPNKDWETMLPFLNTNMYLFLEKGAQSMIDFSSIQGLNEGKDSRLELLANFFKRLISNIKAIGYPVSMRITRDVFIEKIEEHSFTFKSNRRMKEIDAAVAEHQLNEQTWGLIQWQNFMSTYD